MATNASDICQTILDLLPGRGPGKQSARLRLLARAVARTGGDLMDEVRDLAATLTREGTIRVPQKGETVDIATARGPVRFARG